MTNHTPPRLAQFIITALSPAAYREDILGDLQEGYQRLRFSNPKRARYWYWREVIGSAPRLCAYKFCQIDPGRIGLILLAYITALFAVRIWDIHISRTIVQSLIAGDNPPDVKVIRRIYFLLFSLGAILSGFMAASIGFRAHFSFRRNMTISVMPVFVTLTVLTVFNMVSAGTYERLTYVLFRSAMLGAALTGGAYLYLQLWRRLKRA